MHRTPLIALALAVMLVLAALPGHGAAQTQGDDREAGLRGIPSAGIPPVSIPSDHWVYPLLDRMAADGLLDGEWMPGRRPVGGDAIAIALDSAVARASRDAPRWTETAVAAREWLAGEYGVRADRRFRALPAAGGRLTDGPLTDPSAVLAGAELLVTPASTVGLWAEPLLELDSDGLDFPMPRLGAAWAPGPFRVDASYGAQRLGPGASGGLVLHDGAELGWLQAGLDEPVVLPWLLRFLGPFQLSVAGSYIDADSLGPEAAFFSGEVRAQPFPWVTLGLYRTAMVALERDGRRITFADLVASALGTRSGTTANFDDQKASLSASFRARILGVTVNPYAVWGWEDTWEIYEDPGTILGVWLPALPIGTQPVGVRYEYAAFGEPAQIIWPWHDIWDHRNWYRHSNRARYVNGDGEFMGHPLGGYGTEHRLEVEVPLPARGVLAGAALYTRERVAGMTVDVNRDPPLQHPYSNLLYDAVPGRSWGGVVEATLEHGRLRFDGVLELEVGEEDWSRTRAELRGRWMLP